MHNENGDIRSTVLDAIRNGKTIMRPKWHFVLAGALFVSGVLIVFCVTLYLASFAVFSMRETGAWTAPLYGTRGLLPFLRAIPVALAALSLLFIAVLETLVRRYSFAYRAPLLYSLIAVLILVVTASVYIAPFHRTPFRAARHGGLRMGGQLYRRFGVGSARNVRHGTIDSLVEGGFVLRNIEDATSLVLVAPETHLPAGMTFKRGDIITVFGIEDGESIRAQNTRTEGF